MLGAMPRLALALAFALLVPSLACTKLEPTEARTLTGEQAPGLASLLVGVATRVSSQHSSTLLEPTRASSCLPTRRHSTE